MDNLLQQLEKRSVQRCPSDLKQPQDDDELCAQSVLSNSSPNLFYNYNSEPLLKTINSVGDINSYEFLNREKTQPLNFVKLSVDVTRIQANGSVNEQEVPNVGSMCDIASVQDNRQLTNHNESNLENMSQTSSKSQQAKLQKQNAVDLGNLSKNELSDYLSTSLSSSFVFSGRQIESSISEQKCPLNSENVNFFGKGHEEIQSTVPSETIENDVPEEHLENDTSSSELVDVENDTSTYIQESLQEEEIQQFTIPDEIPAVSGWKLDRRESGHLYWRRDSSTLNGVDPRSRVKFRYDVEVCEFESRGSETEDLLDDDGEGSANFDSEEEMQTKTNKDSSVSNTRVVTAEQPFSTYLTYLYFFAVLGIVISLLYSWLTYFFFSGHTEKTQNS